jgi:hypothetical protein
MHTSQDPIDRYLEDIANIREFMRQNETGIRQSEVE